ncbi:MULTISPECIES: primosomal protein N' [Aerococcus]|uniref:Replication restart protein PriA n=1 Tax=Aerococcus sanguinicola TaxID=119206 RepID=A0A5N1GJ46_9LACT|nr:MULTISPECIES: primosomal protein N' [Aerococcus]KAA9300792.1 primosomal protein N' [Aerococcus sanguinicola]MDK6369422.1 primosomal protein N' [Aerococcus sp. UMB9870]MDK6680485.1 primosomal protein N' [Aerococcus sp. UMB8608]MDK6686715.1 primosomal protein N' [Aerococcus sp. UMB8623]OFK15257.1 primosomal protein N' [Aerococcus sp. HMSC072A12]
MTQAIARVIVDVPTRQTDQSYDYAIPDDLLGFVQPGMRVEVPFGVREVQAYVLELVSETAYEGELRPLTALLDDVPVLNQELLDLGRYMADHYFSFLVTCYHAMLPRLLKVKYEKYFRPTEQLSYMDHQYYFADKTAYAWSRADQEGQLKNLLKLKDQGKLTLEYRVEDQKQVKTENWIQPLLDREDLEVEHAKLSKSAHKQVLLCELLMELEGKALPTRTLREDYDLTMQTVRAGERKGWLKVYEQEVRRDPLADSDFEPTQALPLLPEQAAAYDQVSQAMDDQSDQVFLLQGVTGSGKTEVYLQLIQKALSAGQKALLLVPEIALTPQMVRHLKGRFADQVAVLHSQLSVGEQFDEWRRIRRQEAQVVVGARSSIFAPLDNLGLIIIDEEHETSYKQADQPHYHARDLAKWRATYHHCPLVLGSATPSLESRARAQNGVYQLLTIRQRANKKPLPQVEIVDMREEFRHKNYYQFSRKLRDAIQATIDQGQQVALMLNRRGFASYMMCRDCGYVFKCEHCDVSLTYHYHAKSLDCHYCGYSIPLPQRCPLCLNRHLRDFGTGTERVQQEIEELFPRANLVRLDNDTTRRKGSTARLLKQVETGEADILLGTQMIAKGLDFPNITLVGVINADTALNLPDFRSSEKTFQLLTQVSGRAGRGDLPGRVFIQTYNPDHYAIQLAQSQDYDRFYQKEMSFRKLNHYSPYYYTIRLTVSHFDQREAQLAMTRLARLLRDYDQGQDTRILGPSQAPIARMKNRYYFQLLFQYRKRQGLDQVFKEIQAIAQEWSKKQVYVAIDVEPMSFI